MVQLDSGLGLPTAPSVVDRQGALQATSAIISKYPKLAGISYDYGDATVGVIRAS